MRIAVIIKHPYRDNDYRVDLVELKEGQTPVDVQIQIEREMLGPFQVIAMTSKVSEREVKMIELDKEDHL